MLRILYRIGISALCLLAILTLISVGMLIGSQFKIDILRPFLFDSFTLIGSWVSGIGTVAAVIAAFQISLRERKQEIRDEKIKTLQYMMGIVNDLIQRTTAIKLVLTQGGRPLSALTTNSATIMRRYESLYDRDLYTHLDTSVVGRITNLSGSFGGIETIVSMRASEMENRLDRLLPAAIPFPVDQDPFEKLIGELNDLFTALEGEWSKIEII